MNLEILHSYFLLLIPVLLVLIYLASRNRKAFGHTQVESQVPLGQSTILAKLPVISLSIFLTLLIVALARPVMPETKARQVLQTRDFVIAVDISGSMLSEISDPKQLAFNAANPQPEPPKPKEPKKASKEEPKGPTRLFVAQKAIDVFVKTRKDDRIGLLMFDDEAYYSWPITSDLNVILKRNKRTADYKGGGTNFDGPDGTPYSKLGPVQAAVDHFRQISKTKSKVLVMVTDGEANINPNRLRQLEELLAEDEIKLYVLGIGEGWVEDAHATVDLRHLSEASGGKVLVVGVADEMQAGFDAINALEKTSIESETALSYLDIFHWFIIAGLAFSFLYLISTVLVRDEL
jgi:Ca-activated chloride channel family protein